MLPRVANMAHLPSCQSSETDLTPFWLLHLEAFATFADDYQGPLISNVPYASFSSLSAHAVQRTLWQESQSSARQRLGVWGWRPAGTVPVPQPDRPYHPCLCLGCANNNDRSKFLN